MNVSLVFNFLGVIMQELFEESMASLNFQVVDRYYLVDEYDREVSLYMRSWVSIPRTNSFDEDDWDIFGDPSGFIFTR